MAKHDDRFKVGDYLLFKREDNRVYRIVSTATKQAKGTIYTIFTLRSLCGEYWRTNQRSRTLRREYVCNDTVKILYGSVDDDIQLAKLQTPKSPKNRTTWVRRGNNIAITFNYDDVTIAPFKREFVDRPTITIDGVVLPAHDSQQPNQSDGNS